jgi:hypothetical protein
MGSPVPLFKGWERQKHIKQYTEALKSGEWKYSLREYQEKKRSGEMGRKPTNQTHSGTQKRVSQKSYEGKL